MFSGRPGQRMRMPRETKFTSTPGEPKRGRLPSTVNSDLFRNVDPLESYKIFKLARMLAEARLANEPVAANKRDRAAVLRSENASPVLKPIQREKVAQVSELGRKQHVNRVMMNKDASKQYCVFCFNNRPWDSRLWSTHVCKHPDGRTACPILRQFTCQICGLTGDFAHTQRYCPTLTKMRNAEIERQVLGKN